MIDPILKGVIGGVAVAALVDLRSFSAARKLDKGATFDFALCFTNCLIGAIVGGGASMGLGVL